MFGAGLESRAPEMTSRLSALLLPYVSGREPPTGESLKRLEEALPQALAAARAAWPTLAWETADFLRYLGERLPAEESLVEALRSVQLADLVLAYACGRGDRNALQIFDE